MIPLAYPRKAKLVVYFPINMDTKECVKWEHERNYPFHKVIHNGGNVRTKRGHTKVCPVPFDESIRVIKGPTYHILRILKGKILS